MLTLSANTPLITWSIVVALVVAAIVYALVRLAVTNLYALKHHRVNHVHHLRNPRL